jgi:hypothetical protein
MKILLSLFLLSFSYSLAAPYLCPANNVVYSQQSDCSALCSDTCQELVPSSNQSSGTCNTSSYQGFVFFNGKTYALTKNKGFWEDFPNTAVVSDESIRSVLVNLMLRYSILDAWIGLYDPQKSQTFGTVDPSRFVWRDSTQSTFFAWASGQPDNRVESTDIGKVSILGEHWVYMDSSGSWYDDGYHASYGGDYKPMRYALVEWNGALDCVNGEPQNQQSTNQDLVDVYCNGETPCYLCGDGNETVDRCSLGNVYNSSNQDWLCPIEKTACAQSVQCKSGTDYRADLGKCVATPTPVCPSGGSLDSDGYCKANFICPSGSVLVNGYCQTNPVYRLVANIPRSAVCYRDWLNYDCFGDVNQYVYDSSWLVTVCTLCDVDFTEVKLSKGSFTGRIVLTYDIYDDAYWYISENGIKVKKGGNGVSGSKGSVFVDVSGDIFIMVGGDYPDGNPGVKLEVYECPQGYTYNSGVCITNPSCPSGYVFSLDFGTCVANPTMNCPYPEMTYNTQTKLCEYVPNVNYSCPYDSSKPCIDDGTGAYFCSPYNCTDATSLPVSNGDTQEGANDKQADGEFDDSGNCKGTIYIFNGNDYRCRPPGVQTGFSDCCKKTKTWFGLGSCSPREKILAKLRTTNKGKDYTLADAQCHYVGDYCAEKWLGTCVQKKKTFCCFGSVLARIVHEQGRPQIGLSWGSAKSPNCRGFTPQELQSIDFGKIDFSEYEKFISDEVDASFKPDKVQENMQDKIQEFYDNNNIK